MSATPIPPPNRRAEREAARLNREKEIQLRQLRGHAYALAEHEHGDDPGIKKLRAAKDAALAKLQKAQADMMAAREELRATGGELIKALSAFVGEEYRVELRKDPPK